MATIEEIERAEQARLRKITKTEQERHDYYEYALPKGAPYESPFSPTTVIPERRSLKSNQKIFVKPNIKKDNEFNLKANQAFEVINWNPFIIHSLDNGATLHNVDPSLFIS